MHERTESALCGARLLLLLSLSGCTLVASLEDLSKGGGGAGGTGGESTGDDDRRAIDFSVGSGGSGGAGGRAPECPAGPVEIDAYVGLRLNELAPNGEPDWLELVNLGPGSIELCGCMLAQKTDGTALPPDAADIHVLGAKVMAAGERSVVASLGFGLSKDEPESIGLFDPHGALVDHTAYVASPAVPFAASEVWARTPDGAGEFVKSAAPTPGAPNP